VKVRANLIDRLVGFVSPAAGVKRLQARRALNLFEGGDRGRRTKHWRTPNTSIQADTRSGLSLLRARSRDLAQNNAFAAAAHRELPANIIGTGIRPQVKIADEDQRRALEQYVEDWFKTTACDVNGQLNFFGIQNMVAKSVVEAGEALVIRKRRAAGMSGIPLQIEVLDPDHIDTSKDGIVTGRNTIIQGIEYSPRGQRVAYWLYEHHPGDQFYRMTNLKSRRVPARDVLHVYRLDRPGQVRGVPWSAPILLKLRDYDEYEDAQLIRQKIAACFSVFITPGDQFGSGPGRRRRHHGSAAA
jgi:lambda family phage portal protein